MEKINKKLQIEETKELYDSDYIIKYKKRPIYRLSRLLPYIDLKKTDVVVDIGCGGGALLEVIHDKVSQYFGIDFSEEFIDVAKNRTEVLGIKNANFECADIIEFCQRNKGKFDNAFALDFSEHIYDEQLLQMYTSILKSLKPRGKFYIHSPNGTYLLEILKKKGIIKQLTGHIAVRNAEEHMKLLYNAGFKSIEIYYISHYILPLSYLHLLSYLPLVGNLFKARLFIGCSK